MQRDSSSTAVYPPFHDGLLLALLLFVFWIVLSGKLDLFHLGAGAIVSVATGLVSNRLYALEPPIGPRGRNPFATIPWGRVVAYIPWLGWQILLSSVQVARIVLSPRLELRPKVFRFTHPLPHGLARTTLANSITLTPGTVTIDVIGDEYVVHTLVEEYARGFEGDSPDSMKARVARVFAGHASRDRGETR